MVISSQWRSLRFSLLPPLLFDSPDFDIGDTVHYNYFLLLENMVFVRIIIQFLAIIDEHD